MASPFAIEQVRRLWNSDDRPSSSAIGVTLGYTKSKVAHIVREGRSRGLFFAPRPAGKAQQTSRYALPEPEPPRRGRRMGPRHTLASLELPAIELPVDEPATLAPPRHVPTCLYVLELRADTGRAPVFCDAPVEDHFSYCPEHYAECYGKRRHSDVADLLAQTANFDADPDAESPSP